MNELEKDVCQTASDTPQSRYLSEAQMLEMRARKLRRYDELLRKNPEVVELIELHYDIKINNAKASRY